MHVYDWLLAGIVLYPLVYVGLPAFAIYTNSGNRRLSRKAFSARIVVIVIAFVGLAFFVDPLAFGTFGVAACLLFPPVIAYWSASRLRDLGIENKYKALLILVPFFGTFYVIYLMFARGRVSHPVQTVA